MNDPTVDRVIVILEATPCVALDLADLAGPLGYGDLDALARRLAADPRLRILDPPGFPDLTAIAPDRAAAYDRVLRAAGLRAPRRVALVVPPLLPPTPDIGALLRATAARLPGHDSDAVVAAAEQAHRALRATLSSP